MQEFKEYRRARREMKRLAREAARIRAWAKYDEAVKAQHIREAQKEEELSWNDWTLSSRI
jgi:hypothetical protein